MDQHFQSDNGVLAIFGKRAYNKLVTILSDCCSINNTCCPTQKYTVTAEVNGCTVADPRYDIFVTSTVALSGGISYSIYGSQNGGVFALKGTGILADGIEAEVATLINNTVYTDGVEWELFVVDSRGNWSNKVSFTTVAC